MPFLTRDSIVAAKIEGTPGTDAVPTVTDALLTYGNPTLKPLANAGKFPRDNLAGTGLANLPSVPGVKAGTFTCQMPIVGSGATGPTTPPDLDIFLRCCGLQVNSSGGPPVTTHTYSYTKPLETCTIYQWRLKGSTSKLYKLVGCMGTISFDCQNSQPGLANITMTGKYAAPVDDASPPSPTFTDVPPEPFNDAGFTFGAFSPIANQVGYDMGNTVILRPSINDSSKTGYIAAMIVKRMPKLTWSQEEELVADFDSHGLWDAQTVAAANIGPIDATTGNIWQMTWPNCTIDDPPDDADQEGLFYMNLGSLPSSDLSLPDNEWNFIFS